MQMNNILLPPINIPCTLFETISLFDDFSADDMQYGRTRLSLTRPKRYLSKS